MSDDYVSESEALADWEDDNCIVDIDDDFVDKLNNEIIRLVYSLRVER